jgi:hypothetical protein
VSPIMEDNDTNIAMRYGSSSEISEQLQGPQWSWLETIRGVHPDIVTLKVNHSLGCINTASRWHFYQKRVNEWPAVRFSQLMCIGYICCQGRELRSVRS